MNSLIVLTSYHHHNTRKVAEAIAGTLGAAIKRPGETSGEELAQYDLVGFGSGIDNGKHYSRLLDFVRNLPLAEGKRCFIFSTSGVPRYKKPSKNHARLREILRGKGYQIVGEFSCRGLDTNGFFKLFGGVNKGRPNEEDIGNARVFACGLK